MRPSRIFLLALVMFMAGGAAAAQFGGFRGFFGPAQNDPPDTEFIFARLRPSNAGGGWEHDYPAAEQHINSVMKGATGVNVDTLSYRIVDMDSEDIFDYPFAYISEPGTMLFTETEAANIREFLDRGGFLMLDDFDGARQFQIMYENMKRVFPDREMQVLTDGHAMLNTFYPINALYVQSPYNYGSPPVFYGIDNEWGDLQVLICFNNDLGDFWEHINEGRFPLELSSEALRLGINFVIYAMTH